MINGLIANSNKNNLNKEQIESQRLECRLVGSYCDEEKQSFNFFYRLLNLLNSIPNILIDLKISFVLELNTRFASDNNDCSFNKPIFYGAAYNLQTKEFCPAVFPNKCPEPTLRLCRQSFTKKGLSLVYHSSNQLFVIDEFRYPKYKNLDSIINASDEFILRNYSTSPHCEPEDFADHVRQKFILLKANQFKALEPKAEFKRQSDGSWLRVCN